MIDFTAALKLHNYNKTHILQTKPYIKTPNSEITNTFRPIVSMDWLTKNTAGKGRVKKSVSSKFHSSINHQNVNKNARDNIGGVNMDEVSGWQWARNRGPRLENQAPNRSSGYVFNIDDYFVNNAKKKRKKKLRQQQAKRQESVSSIKGKYISKNQKAIINSFNDQLKPNDEPSECSFLNDLKFPSLYGNDSRENYFMIEDGFLDDNGYDEKTTDISLNCNENADICLLWRNINNNIESKDNLDSSLEQNSVMQIFLLSQYFYQDVMFSDKDFPELTANQQGNKGRNRELKSFPANEERLTNAKQNPSKANQWLERNAPERSASKDQGDEVESEDGCSGSQFREFESFFTGILNDLGNDFLTDQDLECDSTKRFRKDIHSLYYGIP